MNKIVITLVLLLASIHVKAQVSFEQRILEIKNEIKQITSDEKNVLKQTIESINEKLDRKEISATDATQQKKLAAQKCADQIHERVKPLEDEIQSLISKEIETTPIDLEDKRIENLDEPNVNSNSDQDNDNTSSTDDSHKGHKPYKTSGKWRTFRWNRGRGEPRTTTQFVFAFGLNNVIKNGDLGTIDESQIKLSNSRFYEFGWTWKTRLIKNSGFLNLKYGISLTRNNLKPDNNLYFEKQDTKTILREFPYPLKDNATFRMTNWVIPVHLEFDFSTKRKGDDDKIIIKTQRNLRLGLGGYAGINSGAKQWIDYRKDGLSVHQHTKGDFNTSSFIYGLSGYIGYKDISIYSKYDLNPLFRNNIPETNNISIGLRFDFH
jgi:hypothetical protein